METRREKAGHALAAASTCAAAISSVMCNDDLLAEILLRLAFPTSLVRAAAVCRRWLRAASDPAFLRRFRDAHPPRPLGFYVSSWTTQSQRFQAAFVPLLPQPPELAAVLRRGRFGLDACASQSTRILHCRNGRVAVSLFRDGDFTFGVYSPLHPARGLFYLPPRMMDDKHHRLCIFRELFYKESGDGLSYFWFSLEYSNREEKGIAFVYKLQDDDWIIQASATTPIPRLQSSTLNTLTIFLEDDKIYMAITVRNIFVLDLTTSTFSKIKFPDRVALHGEIMLSRANGSGVYLVHVNELKLGIWLHGGSNSSTGDWLLVDTFCLRDLCASLKIPNCTTEDGYNPVVYIHEVGDNAEFVFLEMNKCVFYLDVKSRALQNVYNVTEKGTHVSGIQSFMMTWPPIFPALSK